MTPDIAALKAKLESVRDDPDNRLGSRWRVIEQGTVEELLHALSRLTAPLPAEIAEINVSEGTRIDLLIEHAEAWIPKLADLPFQDIQLLHSQLLDAVKGLAQQVVAQRKAAPLPAEIAGLIERLENRAYAWEGNNVPVNAESTLEWEAAGAIRAQAQEIERLKSDETLQSLAEQCRLECTRAEKAEAERDAIRRKTIEEANAALLKRRDELGGYHKNAIGLELAASIVRALAQTDENKPETEK